MDELIPQRRPNRIHRAGEITVEDLEAYMRCPGELLYRHKKGAVVKTRPELWAEALHATMRACFVDYLEGRSVGWGEVIDNYEKCWPVKGDRVRETLLAFGVPVLRQFFNKMFVSAEPIAFSVPVWVLGSTRLDIEYISKGRDGEYYFLYFEIPPIDRTPKIRPGASVRAVAYNHAARKLLAGGQRATIYAINVQGALYQPNWSVLDDLTERLYIRLAECVRSKFYFPRRSNMCKQCSVARHCEVIHERTEPGKRKTPPANNP